MIYFTGLLFEFGELNKLIKSCVYPFWLLVLVSGLFLVALPNFDVVQASTEITGVIDSTTSWSEAGSPYNIAGPVLVSKGVTLTIEAGVTVIFNDDDYYI